MSELAPPPTGPGVGVVGADEWALTLDEHALVQKLGECAVDWRQIQYAEPRPVHEPDIAEFVAHIHDLQHAVMARAAARLWPDRYRL